MSLQRLSLRNFVIVESVDVDFDAGFSVLTGETGAGKSILIDALQWLLGGRTDPGQMREGANRMEVQAVRSDCCRLEVVDIADAFD